MLRFRCLVAVLALLAAEPAAAVTITVTNASSSGAGSLRQAILDANATVAADTIQFAIPGGGVKNIAGALPPITQPLTINGYSQAGASVGQDVSPEGIDAVILIEVDGQGMLPSGTPVIRIDKGPTTIRGLAIRGIGINGSGIEVSAGVLDVVIKGNFIGTNAAGNEDRSSGTGITNRGVAQIGGIMPADRNLISGNSASAIVQMGPEAVIEGNLIGTDADAAPALGNGRGILVTGAGAGARIGGLAATGGNLIAGNAGTAITVSEDAGQSTSILGNRIVSNSGPGIDLGDDGVTPNDEDDADTGPNGLQNSFEPTLVLANGLDLRIEGYLNSAPGNYIVQLFATNQLNGNGFAEGVNLLISSPLTIEEGETVAFGLFSVAGDFVFDSDWVVTATATRELTGATSEFSTALPVTVGGEEIVVTNTAASGAGSLAAAVAEANANANANTIVFDIPGGGTKTIPIGAGLVLEHPTVIDGYRQDGTSPNTASIDSNAVLRIAVNASGATDADALTIEGSKSLVRGLAIGDAPKNAIVVRGDEVRIEGNFIGLDVVDPVGVGSAHSGIAVDPSATGTVIGGSTLAQRNVIADNGRYGVDDNGIGTVVRNNVIGALSTSSPSLGNGFGGIFLGGMNAVVGGEGAGNTLRANDSFGVGIFGGSGHRVSANSIVNSLGLGIDLETPGVTANDVDDVDGGSNRQQNFPEIGAVGLSGEGLHVSGTLDVGLPGDEQRGYRLEFFANQVCDVTGHGEGELYLGGASLLFSNGSQGFSVTLPGVFPSGAALTATATDLTTDDSSEFSFCKEVPIAVCGDVSGNGTLAAGDALLALKAAVGTEVCADCICNVNGLGGVTSGDALAILRKAVGQNVTLECDPC